MGQILVGRLFSLIWHECGSCVVLSWWQGWSQDPSPHIPGALAAMAQLGPYSLHPFSRLLFIISPVRQSDFSTEHMETASPFRPDLDQGWRHSSLLHWPKQSEANLIHREEEQTLIFHWRGRQRKCSCFPSTRECYQNYFVHLM